jgi:antitoxin MazE
MKIQIGKWGNSLAVRIPSSVVKDLGLADGANLDVTTAEGALILKPARRRRAEHSLEDLLAGVSTDTLHRNSVWGKAIGER